MTPFLFTIYLTLRRINKKFEYSSIVNELFRVRNNSLKQKRKKKTIDKLTSRLGKRIRIRETRV